MNYKMLKRLCDDQKQQIERWKHYCHRAELLLLESMEAIDYHEVREMYELADRIEKFVEVNNVR